MGIDSLNQASLNTTHSPSSAPSANQNTNCSNAITAIEQITHPILAAVSQPVDHSGINAHESISSANLSSSKTDQVFRAQSSGSISPGNLRIEIEEELTEDPQELDSALNLSSDAMNGLTLEQIQALAATNDPSKSTQALLCEIVQGLQELYKGSSIKIKAELVKTNGQFEIEPFILPSSNQNCYKTRAIYTIEVDGNKIITNIAPITRDLFTTAIKPELALLAASNYKDTVSELVFSSLGLSKNIDLPTDAARRIELMNQQVFHYKFLQNKAGKTIGIASIHTDAKGNTELKRNKNSEKDLGVRYAYHLDTGDLERLEGIKPSIGGQNILYYASEEEALLNMRHSIKNDDFYSQLTKKSSFQSDIQKIKDSLQIKQNKIKELESLFEKESSSGTTIRTKEFELFLADLSAKNSIDISTLSPAKQAYLEKQKFLQELQDTFGENQTENICDLKDLLADFQKDFNLQKDQVLWLLELTDMYHMTLNDPAQIQDLQALLIALEKTKKDIDQSRTELKAIKKQMSQEKKPLLNALHEMESLNRELVIQFKQLEEAKNQADQKLDAGSPHDQDKAEFFLELFSDQAMATLKNQLEANDRFVTTSIRDHLPMHLKERAIIPLIDVIEHLADLNVQASHYLQQNNLKEAAYFFQKGLKLNPYDTDALAGYAKTLYLDEKFDEAKHLFERLLMIKPEDVTSLNYYGAVLIALNQLIEAEKQLLIVLNISADQKTEEEQLFCLSRYAEVLSLQKKTKASLKYFKEALKIDANDFFSLNGYGKSLLSLKRYKIALLQFKKISELNPDNFMAKANYAYALSEAGQYAEAKSLYETFLTEELALPSVRADYAKVLFKLGQYKESKENYFIVFDEHSKSSQFLTDYAYVLLALEEHEEADKIFTRALTLDPASEAAKTGLAEAKKSII